jgi:membrane protein DedA with SNARE-associated domain
MVSAVLAGSSTLTWRRYLLGEIPGVCMWAAVSCALGFYGSELGERLRPVWAGMHHATWIFLAGAFFVALVMRKARRHRAAPTAND